MWWLMAKKITNLLAKITSGLSHAFLSSQLEFSASQHMYGILIWSTKTMIPLEMHICQVPKISFLAYLEWSTNKIMAGKAFWGCSAPICQFFEFRQVHLNSYSEQFLRGFCTSGAQLMQTPNTDCLHIPAHHTKPIAAIKLTSSSRIDA